MKLTEHQKNAADNIIKKIVVNKPTVLSLSGRAGTGKTTVLKHILSNVINTLNLKDTVTNKHNTLTIDCIAPTREATRILSESVKDIPTKKYSKNLKVVLNTSTVYSFLSTKEHHLLHAGGIKRESLFSPAGYNKKTASQHVIPSTYKHIIIIDEISLLSAEERRLIDIIYSESAIVLLVGDTSQANLDFLGKYKNDYLVPAHQEELLEPIRQSKESHIFRLSEYFRLAMNGEKYDLKPGEFSHSNDLIPLTSWEDLIDKFVHQYDTFVYLAWTNRGLSQINHMMVTNNTNPDFPHKCTFALNSPIQLGNDTYYKGTRLRINNDIVHLRPVNHAEKMYKLSKDEEKFNILRQLRECSVLAPLRTIHSVQGLTIPEVIIDTSDLNNIHDKKDLARLYYTAISRATDKVYFTNMTKLKEAISKVQP